jgi:CTP:molybdopterin cytidylyltransferase MocA
MGGVAKALLVGKDGRTFLQRIVETAREVGVACPVVVIARPFAAEVGPVIDRLGAASIVNPEPERGMGSSVATGFGALQEILARAEDMRPGRSGAFSGIESAWLWPVDHPDVSVDTLRRLISALMNHEAARPVYEGRGGHPPLIAKSLFAQLSACADLDGGARTVLAAADTVNVPVDDRGCVRDVDTVLDLEGA